MTQTKILEIIISCLTVPLALLVVLSLFIIIKLISLTYKEKQKVQVEFEPMMKDIPQNTKFVIKDYDKHYFVEHFYGKEYTFIKENIDNTTEWLVDDDYILLDRFQTAFGFPYYLREIYAQEMKRIQAEQSQTLKDK